MDITVAMRIRIYLICFVLLAFGSIISPLWMASPTWIGSLSEFSSQTKSFASYVEHVKLYLANDNELEKQLAGFLSILGTSMYSILRVLEAPCKPLDCALDVTIDVLQAHFEPRSIVITERFHFHCCCQLLGESVTSYVAQL